MEDKMGERREENGGKERKEGEGKRGAVSDFITVTRLLRLESDRLWLFFSDTL